jgi:hypothetical protein
MTVKVIANDAVRLCQAALVNCRAPESGARAKSVEEEDDWGTSVIDAPILLDVEFLFN